MSRPVADAIPALWLGRVPVPDMVRRMARRRAAVLAGHASEVLWLLEHPATITTGRRRIEPPLDEVALAARGVPVVPTDRGGLATWHGPGQLVGYLVAHLRRRRVGVRHAVFALEQGLVDWLAGEGVSAHRVEGAPGVFVAGAKLGFVGLHVHKGVSTHGFALNVAGPLDGFQAIVPCGLQGVRITSVSEVAGRPCHVGEALAGAVGERVLAALQRKQRALAAKTGPRS